MTRMAVVCVEVSLEVFEARAAQAGKMEARASLLTVASATKPVGIFNGQRMLSRLTRRFAPGRRVATLTQCAVCRSLSLCSRDPATGLVDATRVELARLTCCQSVNSAINTRLGLTRSFSGLKPILVARHDS